MRMKSLFIGLLCASSTLLYSQNYTVHLEPITIQNFGGVQSFAIGQHNGKYLIIGGRLDGLHRRQPWASFDAIGHNNQLIVIDPATGTSWSSSIASLSASLQDQLKSTNTEFIQEGNTLYVLGGYGLNSTGNHVTYNKITAVDISGVVQAVIGGQSITPFFRQYTYEDFAVTGGQLYKVNDSYYLVGGQRFDGQYNPMGPTHGPGFTQTYTNAVRRFSIQDDGTNLTVSFDSEFQDATLLHKRDYNAVPSINKGEEGIVALSGVFQPTVDLPWTNAVYIDSSGFAEVSNFTHYYNHYHSAKSSIYFSGTDEMHYFIYGGIAQYYLLNGTRVKDDNVPFVKTISKIVRNANGTLTETPLNVEMPNYLGAGAEFVPMTGIATLENEIIDGSQLSGDTIPIGYIIGGIQSSGKNIFFVNTGVESSASNVVYKVSLVTSSMGVNEIDNSELKSSIHPNPATDQVNIRLENSENLNSVEWMNLNGKLVQNVPLEGISTSEETYTLNTENMPRGEYFLRLNFTSGWEETHKVVLE